MPERLKGRQINRFCDRAAGKGKDKLSDLLRPLIAANNENWNVEYIAFGNLQKIAFEVMIYAESHSMLDEVIEVLFPENPNIFD